MEAEVRTNKHTRRSYGICSVCGGPCSRRHVGTCRDCGQTKRHDVPTLTLEDLTEPQRILYAVIMKGRKVCTFHAKYTSNCDRCSNHGETILLIERATKRNELEAELEYWTAPISDSVVHKTTSLSLMFAYAPGAIS
jgi:hypothetical protein